jgi:putative spermidine/putrescine transport system substrate-binding protein
MKPEVAKSSPTYPDNIRTGVQINAKYWLENQAAVTERFNSWVLK